ncbi:MAG: cytochrome c biogenesis protein CcsA [Sphingobacteriia bacterium]
MTAGTWGFLLSDLAFVSAVLAAVAYGLACTRPAAQASWQRFGHVSFGLHALSVIGILALLWGMIFSRQYQYAYVYDHSSNSLPPQYIVASLWEGQEGSFLLWMFWHALLGLLLMWRAGRWRPGVLAVISSVQAVLASMILGVSVGPALAQWGLALLALFLLGLLLWPYRSWPLRMPRSTQGIDYFSVVPVAAGVVCTLLLVALFRGQTAWWSLALQGSPAHLLQLLLLLALLGLLILGYRRGQLSMHILASGLALAALSYVLGHVQPGAFKVGSSPFLTLAQAFPANEMLQRQPGFVPPDGEGLNALLQNYWMVIHPPTLFLGFASTVVAFAYVLTGLWQRRYAEWIAPASPWALFSVMILGVGIIMGGYWAYETLNFGGYWNWDPVENSSLVPWLVGVGGLHAMLSYRKSKRNLRMAMILMSATFVLVLYSTFLTRSGILGETSVHSFTDLGLSGQLLLLLGIYFSGVILLFVQHWRHIPTGPRSTSVYSREFFLFLAAIVLSFTAIEILLVTSIPVLNAIFGTRMAPPGEVQYFYYRWNVWFGLLIALLSAIGQFFYWTKIEKATLQKALFRPFLLAALCTVLVMVLIWQGGWEFAFQEKYRAALAAARDQGLWAQVRAYLNTAILVFADDLLLFAALFTLLANGTIILRLLRRSRRNLRHTGGSLAHIGFGLMLLGILFSSGYEQMLSINLNPAQLEAGMGADQARTNVVLAREKPVDIRGYRLVYRGVRTAQPPFSNYRLITAADDIARIGFTDATGEDFGVSLPVPYFLKERANGAGDAHALESYLNFDKIAYYVSNQAPMLPLEMLNGRKLYTVDFYPLDYGPSGAVEVQYGRAFRLFPEAEPQGEDGIIAHPDRAIFIDKDIYTHVTGRPGEADSKLEWELVQPEVALSADSGVVVDGIRLQVGRPERLPTPDNFGPHELLTHLPVTARTEDSSWTVYPKLMINKQTGIVTMVDAWLPQLDWRVRFSGVATEADQYRIAVAERKPQQDYVILNARSKPWVNLLWLGTVVMTLGFLLAIWRRLGELHPRDKGPAQPPTEREPEPRPATPRPA